MIGRWLSGDRSAFDADPRTLAVVAVATLAAALVAAFGWDQLSSGGRYEVAAVFEDSGGLRTGATVTVAGVEIGEVRRIDPDFSLGQVVVTLALDEDVEVGADARAAIAPNTVLGGFHVRLQGPVEGPLLADLPDDERRIPIERTRASFTVVEALEATTETVDRLDLDALDTVLDRVGDVASSDPEAFVRLADRFVDLEGLVEDHHEELVDLLDQGSHLVATLRTRDEEVLDLADQVADVIGRLVDRRTLIADALGDGRQAIDRFSDLLEASDDDVRATLDHLDTLLTITDERLDEINEGLTVMPGGLHGLADGGASGSWLHVVLDSLIMLPMLR